MTMRFDDRVAIITGAGSGLGRSHALLLAARGARVLVNDPGPSRNPGRPGGRAADDVVAEIRAAGGEAVANYESVADQEGAARIVEQAASQWGRVDILVNNAGVLRDKSFGKMDLADWDLVLRVHLSGTAYCTRAAWPHMQRAGYGRIVLTTSNSGLYGNFGQSNYAAAKMGMLGLMNVLALEGARAGILVNAIAPVAATPMTEAVLSADLAATFDPGHVSAAVAVLCSEDFARTGLVCSAAAGRYALVQVASTKGVQFDPAKVQLPETILAAWDGIADAGALRRFPNAGAETAAILADVAALAGSAADPAEAP